jgi:hypothetical protein
MQVMDNKNEGKSENPADCRDDDTPDADLDCCIEKDVVADKRKDADDRIDEDDDDVLDEDEEEKDDEDDDDDADNVDRFHILVGIGRLYQSFS